MRAAQQVVDPQVRIPGPRRRGDVGDFGKRGSAAEEEHAGKRLPHPRSHRDCVYIVHEAGAGDPDQDRRRQEDQGVNPDRVVLSGRERNELSFSGVSRRRSLALGHYCRDLVIQREQAFCLLLVATEIQRSGEVSSLLRRHG